MSDCEMCIRNRLISRIVSNSNLLGIRNKFSNKDLADLFNITERQIRRILADIREEDELYEEKEDRLDFLLQMIQYTDKEDLKTILKQVGIEIIEKGQGQKDIN